MGFEQAILIKYLNDTDVLIKIISGHRIGKNVTDNFIRPYG